MSLRGLAAARIVTCDPARATETSPLGVVEDGVVLFDGPKIAFVGPRADAAGVPVVDLGARVVTPGLVDAHTHAAWVGSRHAEYALRMAGADYRAIAAAGGGIVASHRAVADATDAGLDAALEARLGRMLTLGVTTCEVKSGYGLTPELERRQLEAIARVARRPGLPHVVATFLALHAVPPGHDRDAFVEGALALVPEIAARGLATFVDAYVDQNAFRVEEARALGHAARAAHLGVRLHAGQFADVGGAELAAELGARSADHLEHVGDDGAAALAAAGVFAGLLPTACFTLGQAPPPVARLRRHGVRLVVASDANPGTAPTESLPLALAFAVRLYGLTPEEALLGATRHAAESLGLGAGDARARGALPTGALVTGHAADVVGWDVPHELALVQPWGSSRAAVVVARGARVRG